MSGRFELRLRRTSGDESGFGQLFARGTVEYFIVDPRALLGSRPMKGMTKMSMRNQRTITNSRAPWLILTLVSSLVLATIAPYLAGSASAAVSSPSTVSSGPHRLGVVKPHFTTTHPLYTSGELYGPDNPSAVCYSCDAVNVTGSAPPSESLNAGTGVDSLTGDFSESLPLFNALNDGAPFSLSLSYDAQVAQSELTAGTASTSPFGVGWSSSSELSLTQQTVGSSNLYTVNQGNGSQVTFTGLTNGACAGGDPNPVATTGRFPTSPYASNSKFCALASVQGQLADRSLSEYQYHQDASDVNDYFAWNGTLETQDVPAPVGNSAETLYYYDIAPGASAGYSGEQACPTSAHDCTIIDSGDGLRDIVESLNSAGEVTQIIDPSGVTYTLSYDTSNNLTSVVTDANQTSPSTWHFVYDTTLASPNGSDLEQVYEPDSGVGLSPSFDSGAPHSSAVVYNGSGTFTGMVSTITDGTGATTTYSYQDACSSGQCLAAAAPQQTTISNPAQVPCPSCTAQSPVEVDTYVGGIESSQELGSTTTGSYDTETWQYNWTMDYGSGNSTEVITYPNTLSGTTLTASMNLDSAGDIVSTTNALGDTTTSSWLDTSTGGVHPELIWSYPGSSSNGMQYPPSGSWVYTYAPSGLVSTATDPLGNVTAYQYYDGSSLELCYVAPPTVADSGSLPYCQDTPTTGPGTTAPVGSTVYTYDTSGDVTSTTVDYHDTATGADPQTTTSSYNAMGDELWAIPPAGQSGAQSAANPYATVTTYTPSNLPATVTPPSQGTTTSTYDANYNLTSSAGPAATTTTVYDGDNRECYQLVAGSGSGSGLTCSSSPQSGSTSTTYVPGSTNVATQTDSLGSTTTDYYGDLAFPNSPTEVVDPTNNEIQYMAYNDYGNACDAGDVSLASQQGTSSQCHPVGGDTTTVYNALGNETSVTDPNGNTTTNAYTNTAYPTLVTSTTSALSAATTYSYDADGNLVTTTNPDGSTIDTAYDPDGRVCTQSDNGTAYSCGNGNSEGGVTSYTYNGASDRIYATAESTSYLSASQVSVSQSGDACALSGDSTECWGFNAYGQLGDGNTTSTTTPVSATGISGATSVAAGGDATCVLLSNGSIDCFGDNTQGELGNGTTTSSTTPVPVSGISTASKVVAGGASECALLTGGTVDCWGYNNDGQLGNGNTTIPRLLPR
jgi:YD repeat-containing protein